jgi:hypothetical protein
VCPRNGKVSKTVRSTSKRDDHAQKKNDHNNCGDQRRRHRTVSKYEGTGNGAGSSSSQIGEVAPGRGGSSDAAYARGMRTCLKAARMQSEPKDAINHDGLYLTVSLQEGKSPGSSTRQNLF